MKTKAVGLTYNKYVLVTYDDGVDVISQVKKKYNDLAISIARSPDYFIEEITAVAKKLEGVTSSDEIEALIDELSYIHELILISNNITDLEYKTEEHVVPSYRRQYKAILYIANMSDERREELINISVDKSLGLKYGLIHSAKLEMQKNMTNETVAAIMEGIPCEWEIVDDFDCITLW